MFWNKSKNKSNLTQSVSCAGCAAKLSPELLSQAVFGLKQPENKNLLVGFDKADDAGVYLINETLALVQTLDFFTPIVDDPKTFGMVAATNALSDVYAMGGEPLTAMNILCYPDDFGHEILSQILAGGLEKTIEAGATLVGGHSVSDPQLKFGMSVTGTINPNRVFSNAGAKPGQSIVLTKKLGTGIMTTAAKKGKSDPNDLKKAIKQMITLNKLAKDSMLQTGATACTDVTGFGFMGHLSEVVRASDVSVEIFGDRLPLLDGAERLSKKGFLTRGDKTNRPYSASYDLTSVPAWFQSILFDPQTSGGLLVFMPPSHVEGFINRMVENGEDAWFVGSTFPAKSVSIGVKF